MKKRRNWLRKHIAMITLIATVLETGFSSVSVYGATLTAGDTIDISIGADENVITEAGGDVLTEADSDNDTITETGSGDDDTLTEVSSEQGSSDSVDIMDASDDGTQTETVPLQEDGGISVSDSGISGSGCNDISIYIDTANLANKDRLRIKFTGPDSASYNPILNEELDKTNSGRYDFSNLEGSEFRISAEASGDVILSYINKDGYPTIYAESKSADKILDTRILTAVDDSKISAISGEGYESITIDLDTEDLSDKDVFKFYVESEASATVDGKSANDGIGGLTKEDTSLKVEGLDGEEFVAYVVSDDEDSVIESVAQVVSVEDGVAEIDINNVATKRVYEYEDEKVYVRATLEKADAVPDDAYFAVTPLTEEEAEKYLAALNENKEEGELLATAENTLLYDIGFYTDETKSEEIEPEEGSVSVAIEFKESQLSEGIEAKNSEDVVLTHIVEDGSTIKTEEVARSEVSVDNESIEFTTDSFSLYAVQKIRGTMYNTGEGVTYRDVLMGAVNYGLVANDIWLTNHVDSNMATVNLHTEGGAGNTTQGRFSGAPGNLMLAKHDGEKWFPYSDGDNAPFMVITTEKTAEEITNNPNWRNYIIVDDSHTEEDITKVVNEMVSGTLSSEFNHLDAKQRNSINTAVTAGEGGTKVIDISSKENDGGTYVIDFAEGEVGREKAYFNSASQMKIRLRMDQMIVFNIPDKTDLDLYKFEIEITDKNDGGPKSIGSDTSDTSADEFCRHVVFNFPNLEGTATLRAVLGMFLAPSGTLRLAETSTGWAVANRIENGSGEWHCVWAEMEGSTEIEVNKKFIGGAGNWQDGFRFKLERLDGEGRKVDTTFAPQYITLNGGESDTASGYFKLPSKLSSQITIRNGDIKDYWVKKGYTRYAVEWYKISEVDDKGNELRGFNGPRTNVEYNIIDPAKAYGESQMANGYPKPGEQPVYDNSPYWFVHVFYYYNEVANAIVTVKRVARVLPYTNCYKGLPCIENGRIEFVNKISNPVKVKIEGEKQVNGDTNYVPNDQFTFSLYDYIGNNKFAANPRETVVNDGSAFEFSEIELGNPTYSEDINGVTYSYYYFKVDESNTCPEPYKPDEAEYIVKVIVKKDGNNTTVSKEYYRFNKPTKKPVNVLLAMDPNTITKADKCTIENKLWFNNTYDAYGEYTIPGTKTLEGRSLSDNDVFTFTLTPQDSSRQKDKQEKSFRVGDLRTNNPNITNSFDFTFDTLSFNRAEDAGNTYTYVVEETTGNDKNIIYSNASYKIELTVVDDHSGTLEVNKSDNSPASCNFTNTYYKPEEVPFKVSKIWGKDTDTKFTFVLKGGRVAVSPNSPGYTVMEDVNQERTVTGTGEAAFDSISYPDKDYVGSYEYTINEVIPDGAENYTQDDPTYKILNGIIYDNRTYYVSVEVDFDDATHKLVKTVKGGFDKDNLQDIDIANEGIDPVFENRYEIKPVTDHIEGKKILKKKQIERGAFTFELTPYGDVTKEAVSSNKVVMPAVTQVKNGVPATLKADQFKFDDITFKEAGTYQFRVTELEDPELSDIIFSTEEYIVTIKVSDNGKGKLVASQSTTKDSKIASKITFTNTPVDPGSIPLYAYKDLVYNNDGILEPMAVGEGAFSFELIKVEGTNEAVVRTAENDSNGLAAFEPVQFTMSDLEGADSKDFTFKIREVIPDDAQKVGDVYKKNGITYDGHVETVIVTVTRDGDKIDVTSKNSEEKPAGFENVYEAHGEIDLDGSKIITGREFKSSDEGKWFAVLHNLADGSNDKNDKKVPIKLDAKIGPNAGKFDFGTLTYNKAGEYYYTVKEIGTTDENEQIDGTTFYVHITATDNEDGTLTVAKRMSTVKMDGPEVTEITFNNTYVVPDKVNFRAKKVTYGAAIEDGMFEFKLLDSKKKTLETRKNDSSGNVLFKKEITYKLSDVENSPFTYYIVESTKSKKGWTLDTKEFQIDVSLSVVEDDDTKVKSVVADKKYYKLENGSKTEVDEAAVIFENTYQSSGSVELAAEKILIDREVPAGQFKFELYSEEDELNPILVAENAYARKGKKADVVFPAISYIQGDPNDDDVPHILDDKYSHPVGEHKYARYYKMKEWHPDEAVQQYDGTWKYQGYTYDATEYKIVVILTDNLDGTIDTDWFAYKTGESPKESTWVDKIKKWVNETAGVKIFEDETKNLLFTNTYEAAGEIQINAKKILEGKALEADIFEFMLSGDDENGKHFEYREKNALDGTVSFSSISYTKEGEYEYTVEEIIPDKAEEVPDTEYKVYKGIYYSTIKHTVKVKVEDTQTGLLNVTAWIDGAKDAVTSIEVVEQDGVNTYSLSPDNVKFVNKYIPKGTSVTPGGTKTLHGRNLKDREFEFTLSSNKLNPKSLSENKVNVGEEFKFSTIEFTADDMKDGDFYVDSRDFGYTITEKTGELPGVTYSTAVYDFVVRVTDIEGQLYAVVLKDGIKTAAKKVAHFDNYYNAEGTESLIVRKEIKGAGDRNKLFKFMLYDEQLKKFTHEVELKADEEKSIADFEYKLSDLDGYPDGRVYKYTVTEWNPNKTGEGDGWTYSDVSYEAEITVKDKGDGTLDVSKVITKDGDPYTKDAMVFENEYHAKGNTTLDGEKEFVNGTLKGGDFTFLLEEYKGLDSEGKPIYEFAQSTTNDINGKFSFTLPEFDESSDGTRLVYRVREDEKACKADAKGKIKFDDTVYDVVITVKDTKDGKLAITKRVTTDGKVVDDCIFRFVNTDVEPGKVDFDAEKSLTGLPLKDQMFEFTLTGNGQGQKKYNNGKYITFDPIEYTLDDVDKTFKYTIKESTENPITGMTYDNVQYTAVVDVSLSGNQVVANKKIFRNGDRTNQIVFENSFEASVSVPIGGSKKLDGYPDDAPSLGKYSYSFGLYDENGHNIETRTITPTDNKKPVEYSFTDLKFDQDSYLDPAHPDHIFTYTVKEIVPEYEKDRAPNVKYDQNEYTITVKLEYDQNYKLTAEASTDHGVSTKALDFTNIYEAEGSVKLHGIKTIEGKELENGAYTFELTDENGKTITKKNEGIYFSFPEIKYSPQDLGTHVYKITESAYTEDGSKYDSTEYTCKVTVEEGSDGKLVIDKDLYRKADGESMVQIDPDSDITFKNTYTASGSIPLKGTKVMHNKPLAKGDFSFVLKEQGNPDPIQTVTHEAASLNNKKDLEARAAFKFDDLKFTQEDLKAANGKSYLPEVTKYYTIEEIISNKGGVTYSNAAYVVAVTIKDKGKGKLEVTKSVAGNSDVKKNGGSVTNFLKGLAGKITGRQDEIVFYNDYNSQCTIDPPILRKEIMGRDIERGEFSFKIEGPGLRSMNKAKYEKTVDNGINPETHTIYDKNNKEIDPGEIYVGDITYKYIDLVDDDSFSLEKGAVSANFVYYATEIDKGEAGVGYSDQKFKLVVTVIENGDGTMTVKNANGEVVDGKNTKLFWEPVNPYALNEEQLHDTFLNTWNKTGSIDIVGVKKMEGRELSEDDIFEFTITDEETGASRTITNTVDKNGKPSIVAFNAADIDFLNYRQHAFITNPDRADDEEVKWEYVDDTGIHKYLIEEKPANSETIINDTSKFEITVDVKEAVDENGAPIKDNHGHGLLDAKIIKIEQIFTQNNKVEYSFTGNNAFEFVNKFRARGTLTLEGSKYLEDQNGEAVPFAEDPIEGKFKFTLYSYDSEARTTGRKIEDTATTDKDGKFTLKLPVFDQDVLKNEKGEYETSKTLYYRIIETKPSEGQWINDNTVFESNGIVYDNTEYDVDVTVTYEGTNVLKVDKVIKNAATGEQVTNIGFTNIQNKEYVTVPVNKHWIHNGKELTADELENVPDLTFNLYSSAVDNGKKIINSAVLPSGQLTLTFKTDSTGEELPKYDSKGKLIEYVVEEVAVPGYLSEKKGYDFYNTDGDIKIQKIAADTNEPLAGATLAIYDGSKEVEKWTSGDSAYVVKADLTPGKTYTLRELTAPKGYEIAADVSFTVPADGSDITVTMTDKPIIGAVRLTKRDSATREILTGAEFALYDQAGTRIYATGTAGKYNVTSLTSNGVFTTDSAGVLEISNLPYGAYYFVETKAPEGYVLSSEKIGFTIANGGETVEVTCLNKESLGAVRLRKVSATGDRRLEGAVFELYAATPRSAAQAVSSTIYRDAYYRYGTYTTNSSGEIYVDNLPWDDYYFVEVKAPDGFEIAKDLTGDTLVYPFTVDGSNAGTTIDIGEVVNNPLTGVLGERRTPEEPESGVLGVRSAPKKGVLGARNTPATADVSAIALWLTVMLACIGTIVWVLVDRRKKKARG
ncbi:MAG: Cna B-type domain-containing protein [Lachnospiraceae bacterium]|nr:Cna B-type domain-containing protein [Lachnospiraceae bacterium]